VEADRRQEERLRFCMEECRGTFTIEALGEEYEVEEVTDLSLSGMGFEMTAYLDPDTPIRLVYEEDDRLISLSGKVIWCEDHPSVHGSYQYGIIFDYSARDDNSQLLLALRDYFAFERGCRLDSELEF